MAKKTVKKTVSKETKSATIRIWNQSRIRIYQTEPGNVLSGGVLSDDKKIVSITPNSKVDVKRAYGEMMVKNYPEEIIVI